MTGADPGFVKGTDHGERVEFEPTTGVWGKRPQWGPGTEPLVGVREAKPPKVESFSYNQSVNQKLFVTRRLVTFYIGALEILLLFTYLLQSSNLRRGARIQKGAILKYLNKRNPPMFGPLGAAARSAHPWIRQCLVIAHRFAVRV